MLPKKHRSLAYFSLGLGFAAGYMLTSLLAYVFRDWRWFLRCAALLGLLYIPYYWYYVALCGVNYLFLYPFRPVSSRHLSCGPNGLFNKNVVDYTLVFSTIMLVTKRLQIS